MFLPNIFISYVTYIRLRFLKAQIILLGNLCLSLGSPVHTNMPMPSLKLSIQVKREEHDWPKILSLFAAKIAITPFRNTRINPLNAFFFILASSCFFSSTIDKAWARVLTSNFNNSKVLTCSWRKSLCVDKADDRLYRGYKAPAINAQAASKDVCSLLVCDNKFLKCVFSTTNCSCDFSIRFNFSVFFSAIS